MAKKHNAKQIEVNFGQSEPFALKIEQTTDGDRVAREAAQLETDKQHAEKQQTSFA